MKRKRPRPPPPPDGKVLRRGRSGELEEMDVEMIQDYANWCLQNFENPRWRDDPTYNLRRKKQ